MVDGTGLDLQNHFTRLRLGIRYICILDDIQFSMFMETECFHGRIPLLFLGSKVIYHLMKLPAASCGVSSEITA
jgi:hypothetical protein